LTGYPQLAIKFSVDWYLTLLIVGSTAGGGFLAGVLILLLGGMGVTKQHSRALKAINDDLDALDARITREQNRRKADASVEAKLKAKSAKELAEEASRRLLSSPQPGNTPELPGFGSQFPHG